MIGENPPAGAGAAGVSRRTRVVRPQVDPLGRARLLWILACSAVILALVPAAAPAAGPTVVSLTFNDGNVSQYSYARPVLAAHGVKATFYVASGWVTAVSNSSMSWSQVRNMYRDGHEIGGMGTDHQNLTTLTPTAAQQQVCGDRQTLTAQGLDPQTFTYPAAAVNSAAEATVQGCGYLAARTIGGLVAPTSTTGPWAESIPPADRYAVRTANLPTGAITLSTLQADVNKAAEKGGGWLPISFNQVCHAGSANYSTCMASSKPIDDAVFSQFLDWLQGSGAPAGPRSGPCVTSWGGRPASAAGRPDRRVPHLQRRPEEPVHLRPPAAAGPPPQRHLLRAHRLGRQGGSAVTAWWQLDDLYRDGNEIGGMGVEHQNLTTLNAATAQQQVCDDRSRLSGQGYDPQTFAYPSGAFNASVESIVQGCGYHAARISGGLSSSGPTYAETLPPKDPFAIRTASSGSPISLTNCRRP